MEQKKKQDCSLLDLSPKYPWLIVENLEDELYDKGGRIFFPLHDPLCRYQFRIPELKGRSIQGCFHGWVILSNHPHYDMWSIWNPVTSKVIHLPHLILKDEDFESIAESCLSASPDRPGSVLLLTRYQKSNIVFCRLDRTKKRSPWTEISYAKQLRSITGGMVGKDDCFLRGLTCCDGKVYALDSRLRTNCVIHVDIKIKHDKVVINLVPFVELPNPFYIICNLSMEPFLKGSCVELFYIALGFNKVNNQTVDGVCLYKLDMTSMIWEELQDLKYGLFFIDIAHDSVFYRPNIATELGGYIHIIDEDDKVMQSLRVKDKTVSLSSMPCLVSTSRLSLWECRLLGDHGEIKCIAPDSTLIEGNGDNTIVSVRDDDVDLDIISSMKNKEDEKSHILNIPFDVLERIMNLCVGFEYLNFRATCKILCQSGGPIIRWSKETALSRLQTPWLVVINNRLITFTDPISGDKYFIKTPQELNGDIGIRCSRFGWLLIMFEEIENPRMLFFNPFTCDIRELPEVPYLDECCFSAPPTSPDCIVVGCGRSRPYWHVYVHFVAREQSWRILLVDMHDGNPPLSFPTFHGPDLYVLFDGRLEKIQEIEDAQDYSNWSRVTNKAPISACGYSTQYFLVKGDEGFVIVILGEFGKSIEVFKLNGSTKEWEKIDGLGRHTIYICDTTCMYVEAKTQETENKIYFPRVHTENQKVVFYSLETCTYGTCNGKNLEENLFGTEHHTYAHAWIEPSWS